MTRKVLKRKSAPKRKTPVKRRPKEPSKPKRTYSTKADLIKKLHHATEALQPKCALCREPNPDTIVTTIVVEHKEPWYRPTGAADFDVHAKCLLNNKVRIDLASTLQGSSLQGKFWLATAFNLAREAPTNGSL